MTDKPRQPKMIGRHKSPTRERSAIAHAELASLKPILFTNPFMSARRVRSKRLKIFTRWTRTVLSLMPRRWPISLFRKPAAQKSAISSSRLVSDSRKLDTPPSDTSGR